MGTLVDVLLSTNMSKSSSILFLVVAASWLVCVQSQKVFFGSCPNVATEENFDMSQYAKVWYENRKYCAIFQLGQRCVIANYTDNGDGTYGVTNSALTILFNLPVSVDATLQAVSNTTGELHVSYSGTENAPTSGNYLVLDTDYTGYSIVWSCTDYGLFNSQLLWILSIKTSYIVTLKLSSIGQNSKFHIKSNPVDHVCFEGLKLGNSTRNRLGHLGFKRYRLLPKFLRTFSLLDTFSIEFADTAFGQADKLDILVGHSLRGASYDALDHRFLRDTELATLVDDRVLLDSMITLLDGLIQGRYWSFLSLVLDTLHLLGVDQFLLFLRQFTHSCLGSVGECSCIRGAFQMALPTITLSALLFIFANNMLTCFSALPKRDLFSFSNIFLYLPPIFIPKYLVSFTTSIFPIFPSISGPFIFIIFVLSRFICRPLVSPVFFRTSSNFCKLGKLSAIRVASSASHRELSSNSPILYFSALFLRSSIIVKVTILKSKVEMQHPCLMPPVTSIFSFLLPI